MDLIRSLIQAGIDMQLHIILGGFGLFMLGINLLGDAFKAVAGDRLREYIDKYTSNIFSAILVGALLTGIIQSSSAATVISISLVRAGIMRLDQAIGISLGANIGTTITAIIIGLDIDEFGYVFLFVGAMLVLFAQNKNVKNWGNVSLAFGLTFVGLTVMSDKLMLLQTMPWFEDTMMTLSKHPWWAMTGGAVLTAIINSSSATIAVVQKIYGNGGMAFPAAVAFVFGANIGTTITAFLASIGGSISARRASLFHTLFNVFGAITMMLFLTSYSNMVLYVNQLIGGSGAMAIGVAHFMFNTIFCIIIIPFIPWFMKLLALIIPGEDTVRTRDKLEPLDQELIGTYPEAAFILAKDRIAVMASYCKESLESSMNYLHSRRQEDYDVVFQLEELVNRIDTEVTSYLLDIMKEAGRDNYWVADAYTSYLEILKNYERISDLITNLAEYYSLMFENKEKLSNEAVEELEAMYDVIYRMMQGSLEIFSTGDVSDVSAVYKEEDYLDLMEKKNREKHFQRLADGICTTKVASSVYVDILASLERIGDHTMNVSRYMVSNVKTHGIHESARLGGDVL